MYSKLKSNDAQTQKHESRMFIKKQLSSIFLYCEQVAEEQKKHLLSRPVDLLLSLFLLGVMAFCVFRAFVSETSWVLFRVNELWVSWRHVWALVCSFTGGAGLSHGRLFHIHLSVWAVPQRPCGLSQGYGQSRETLFWNWCLLNTLKSSYFFFLCFPLDAGVFFLCCAPACHPHLWSDDARMQLDVGLDHLPCRSSSSGFCPHCYLCFIKSRMRALCDLLSCSPQTQWCHIGGSLHSRTPFTYRVPADKRWPVLMLNVLLAVAPVLLALRCHTNPAYFMKPVPKGQTSNKKKTN